MGTSDFSKEFLEHLYSSKNFKIKAIYTQPPKKSERGQKVNLSAVHKFSNEKDLSVYCPSNFSESDINNIKKINPDVIVVVAYGLILPEKILMIPSCGAVNVHASLLPKWRGAAPIHRAIMNGDSMTGISIMKMEKGLDEGPTYLQTQVEIKNNDNFQKISKNLIEAGKQTLDIFFEKHQSFWPTQQDPGSATYAYKIQKNEMQIDFNNSAIRAHRKVCAFSPKPGAWFSVDSCKYKIFDTELIPAKKIKDFLKSKKLILSFKEDFLLVNKIQKEGRNIMPIDDFSRGYLEDLKKIKLKYSK